MKLLEQFEQRLTRFDLEKIMLRILEGQGGSIETS